MDLRVDGRTESHFINGGLLFDLTGVESGDVQAGSGRMIYESSQKCECVVVWMVEKSDELKFESEDR